VPKKERVEYACMVCPRGVAINIGEHRTDLPKKKKKKKKTRLVGASTYCELMGGSVEARRVQKPTMRTIALVV
jgi:hypothetical protein